MHPITHDARQYDRIQSSYLRIKPEKISIFRFLLEGYDGLGIITTLAAKEGLVRLQFPASRFAEVMRLVDALAPILSPYVYV